MKKIGLACSLIISITIFSGCAYKGTVSTVQATNIYSDNENKVPGNVRVSVDETSLTKLTKDDAVQGYACAGHKFPVDGTDALRSSIPSMAEQVFESVVKVEGPGGPAGDLSLLFRVERFEPRLKFNQKFFGADAEATAELAVSVTGTRNGARVFGTTAESQRTSSGDTGSFCSGGGQVLANATRDVIKDVLEKLGERMANSQSLRKKL